MAARSGLYDEQYMRALRSGRAAQLAQDQNEEWRAELARKAGYAQARLGGWSSAPQSRDRLHDYDEEEEQDYAPLQGGAWQGGAWPQPAPFPEEEEAPLYRSVPRSTRSAANNGGAGQEREGGGAMGRKSVDMSMVRWSRKPSKMTAPNSRYNCYKGGTLSPASVAYLESRGRSLSSPGQLGLVFHGYFVRSNPEGLVASQIVMKVPKRKPKRGQKAKPIYKNLKRSVKGTRIYNKLPASVKAEMKARLVKGRNKRRRTK